MFKRLLSLTAIVLVMAASHAAQAANTAAFSYTLENLGSGHYEYDFTLSNLGTDKDAIFKFDISGVSKNWVTDAWVLPTGWNGSHPGPNLNFQTNNGSYKAGKTNGIYRLWGQTGGPSPSWTTQVFTWKFTDKGTVLPTSDFFGTDDVKVHVQLINNNWTNGGSSYTAVVRNPAPVPEPSSLLVFAGSIGGLACLFRRK